MDCIADISNLDVSSLLQNGALSNLKVINLTNNNKLHTNIYSTAKLQNDINNIILVQNRLFNSTCRPYNIFLIHDRNKAKIQGVAKANYILIEGDLTVDYQELIRVISHELVHRYIGHILKQSDDNEIKYKWFFEGFTEFYGTKALLETRIINEEEYIKIVNNTLVDYFNSLVINIDFNKITKKYLADESINILSYNKGFILALVSDSILRNYSNNQYCLDDVITQVVRHPKSFSLKTYRRILRKHLPQNLVNNIVLSIYDPDLLKSILPKQIKYKYLKLIALDSYEMCFNLTKSLESKLINGVLEDSMCYDKGLRNGQQLKCCSIDYDQGDVKLKIIENNKQKIIEFNLKKIKKIIPIFK